MIFKAEDLQEEYNFAVEWAGIFKHLWAKGKVKVHPPKVMDGGLGPCAGWFGLVEEGPS